MIFSVSYGLGCAAFVILIALTLLNRRPAGMGLFITVVFGVTALWAFGAAFQAWFMPGAVHALESIRSWMWLQFLAVVLIAADKREGRRAGRFYTLLIPIAGILAFANDLRFVTSTASPIDFDASQIVGRVLISVIGLLVVENLYRNTEPSRRWHIFPLCIAAGALFAYDLFVFVEAMIVRSVDVTLLAARGAVLASLVPLLILTLARNEGWRIDVHVSRRVVFHTATLTAAGLFLLAAAGAAVLLGRIPGEWGAVIKVTFFAGSVILLLAVVSTEGLRARIRHLVTENFYSRRYDHRHEWTRFVETLSAADELEPLQERVIRALANVVESPGGVLFLEDPRGLYRVSTCLDMKFNEDATERADSPFVAAFKIGEVVQDLRDTSASAFPSWVTSDTSAWLAVPLALRKHVIGFIVLAYPRSPVTLNWESFDLLRMIGRQVASYLAEERATRTLADAAVIIAYSKKFAFVVHDIKNLASQQGMLIANARRFGENPEFRADMIRTLENSVARLDGLLSKLRTDKESGQHWEMLDPVPIIRDVVSNLGRGKVTVETEIRDERARVPIGADDLHSVLTHLITNAIEASRDGDVVRVRMDSTGGHVILHVEDEGSGMDAAFIRNELFTPLRSTRPHGHGIGAFQAREMVRGAGGDLEVISTVGRGTLMRIVIPNGLGTVSARETVLHV